LTPEGYRSAVNSLGLTPCRPSFNGSTLHQDRDGDFHQVIDPDGLTPAQRVAAIELLRFLLGQG